MIASRADAPLPLARLRARRQVAEIRAADLRCTSDEAAALLRTILGRDLATDDSADLLERTEGWIAGLHSSWRSHDPLGRALTTKRLYVAAQALAASLT